MLEIMQRQIDRTIVFHFADFIFFHVLFFNVMCFYQSSGSSKFVFNVYQSSALLSSSSPAPPSFPPSRIVRIW